MKILLFIVPSAVTAFSAVSHSITSHIQYLSDAFGAEPSGLISLKSNNCERGVYLNQNIFKDEIILKLPLTSCLRDDEPPQWYKTRCTGDDENQHYNPSKWATRLAAVLIDAQMRTESKTQYEHAMKEWLSMMPDRDLLRSSLPIHWSEEDVESAKCSSLELAVDTAYFARADAVGKLMSCLEGFHVENLERVCNDALDLIQTRSCRVEKIDGVQICPPLRVLAPIFDFINHGSSKHSNKGSSNAYFGLEGDDEGDDQASLVVRARRNLKKDEEVLIDYGDSARPAWKCLHSYGFVPRYKGATEYGKTVHYESEEVAEFFVHGSRYEVTEDVVPTSLVEAAYASYIEEKEGARAFQHDTESSDGRDFDGVDIFIPQVALRIAKRASDAAFDLLIEPASDDEGPTNSIARESSKRLRLTQHHVLLNFANGLRDYAERSTTK